MLGLAELKFRSFLDLVSINGPSGNLEYIDGVGTVWPVLRTGVVHLRTNGDVPFDVRDPFLVVQPDKVERNLGIFHPEGPGLGLAEKEQHAVIFV